VSGLRAKERAAAGMVLGGSVQHGRMRRIGETRKGIGGLILGENDEDMQDKKVGFGAQVKMNGAVST